MATVLAKSPTPSISSGESLDSRNLDDKKDVQVEVRSRASIPPLGAIHTPKKFWFQRGKQHDSSAIATQVSELNNVSQ
jgi:hypothetical protein